MGYTAFKQGKPKKNVVMEEPLENSISFKTVFVSAEKAGNPGNVVAKTINNPIKNSIENLKDYLLTEADVEDFFSSLIEVVKTGDNNEERVAIDFQVEAKAVEQISIDVKKLILEKLTNKIEEIENEDFTFQNRNENFCRNENVSQQNLFS